MKFNREINHETSRATSWFFMIFSLILMGLGFAAKMPWYWCFLFIAFSFLCLCSVIDLWKCRIEDGKIFYFKRFSKRSVKISDSNIILLTEYHGPTRRSEDKIYQEKVRPGEKQKRSKMYALLLSTENIKNLGKSTNSNVAKIYFKKETVFSMSFDKEVLSEVLKEGFSGQIYIFKSLYNDYKTEIDEIVNVSNFDYSKVLVIE